MNIPVGDPIDNTVYLGYPMQMGQVRCKHYKDLIDKLFKKLGGRKMAKLSHAGWLTLINSVL
jgi:hypothetical protein